MNHRHCCQGCQKPQPSDNSTTATSFRAKVEIDAGDESAGWEEVRRLSLTNEELLELAERFQAPLEWLDEEW